jgi:glyoxylase-like metal-dependent hydrolase (beta-lactamase superfamily II)
LIEEIAPRIFRAEIPLPNSPLKATNSYIVKGKNRHLIIDTGMNEDICLDAMRDAVKKLDIKLDKTDFFITHSHIDHIGLVATLASESARVYFNRPESTQSAATIISWATEISGVARKYGYRNNRILQMVTGSNGPEKASLYPAYSRYTFLQENSIIDCDDYSFRVIETPGHSRGHLCLYEANQKMIVCGDHILDDITPNISSRFNERENPLQEYISSLDKVYDLDVKIALPGHRRLITDFKKRINELKQHHEERADEIIKILADGAMNAFQVASRMSWDLSYDTWEEVPFYPKWFAFSEALSHLQYLQLLGKIKRIQTRDGAIKYSLS